jgi:hypothetical protein
VTSEIARAAFKRKIIGSVTPISQQKYTDCFCNENNIYNMT